MTQTSRTRGQRGEQIAESYLRVQGYCTEAKNWRASHWGEIDLIMYHPEQQALVFLEVKTRKGQTCGNPLEAINTIKREKLRRLAEIYLAQRDSVLPIGIRSIRFDVVGIHFPGQGQAAEITHVENAF